LHLFAVPLFMRIFPCFFYVDYFPFAVGFGLVFAGQVGPTQAIIIITTTAKQQNEECTTYYNVEL